MDKISDGNQYPAQVKQELHTAQASSGKKIFRSQKEKLPTAPDSEVQNCIRLKSEKEKHYTDQI